MILGSDMLTEIRAAGPKYACIMHTRSSKWLLNFKALYFALELEKTLCKISFN